MRRAGHPTGAVRTARNAPGPGLIVALAEDHLPVHTRQLLELRDIPESTPSPG